MFARGALLLFVLLGRMELVLGCPAGCSCEKQKRNGKIRAHCNGLSFKKIMDPDSLTNVSFLDLSSNEITSIPSKAFGAQKTLRKLYLMRNSITSLKNGAFMGLSKLNKLDLGHNDLLKLNGEPFKGLRNLKTLDLSNNNLNFINGTVFQGLRKLKELILSYNKFIIIPESTLKPLRPLSVLNLASNDIVCDCHIRWLVTNKKYNKRGLKGTCQYPERLRNTKLSKTSNKDLQCNRGLSLPYFYFNPINNEVAIKGDSFMFTCGTTWISILQINWYKDNTLLNPKALKPNIVIDFKPDLKTARLVSTLKFKKLDLNDTGLYRCTVESPEARVNGQSWLRVLPGGSKFCHAEVTKTVKGTFKWDNIALGGVSHMPCPAGVLKGIGNVQGFAYRNCGKNGVWKEVVANECNYVDKVTQELYYLKQYSVNRTTALRICKNLYGITKNASNIKSDIDVSYVASILGTLKSYIVNNLKIGEIVVRIISNIINVKKEILAEAQMRSKACSNLVSVLEVLANANLVGTKFLTDNVGINLVPVYQGNFQGTTCTATLSTRRNLNDIRCTPVWKNVTAIHSTKRLEASVHLPKSLFSGLKNLPIKPLKLIFMIFRNSKLFPHLRNGSLVENPRVATSVVSFRLRYQIEKLSDPIAIRYRDHQRSDKTPPISVYWDQSRQEGRGSWVENKDCKPSKSTNHTILYCSKLTDKNYYAVVMSVEKNALASSNQEERLMLKAVVYVGAALCALLVLITLITYIVFRKLRYNRDDAAMLMNLCLALLVAVIMFVVGIHHVTNTLMCRAVGVLLHYFILCSLLWVGCGALCLCRLLRTAIVPEEFNPVLRYYMISWGIPLIVCGITVAGNPDNYSVHNYCWLKPNPFFGAFVGPACLVILIDLILYIRLNNLIYNTYNTMENLGKSDDEEPVILTSDELAPVQVESKAELIQRLHDVLPEKNDVLVYQKGSLLVLLLIVINFILGFLLVKFQQPSSLYLVLSCVYALMNVVLGIVLFVFHCLKNSKAKQFWRECFAKCFANKKYLVDQALVSNTDSTEDKPSTVLMNGDTVRDNEVPSTVVIPRIYGAPATPHGSDIQSNVSLPSSAALTISVNNLNNQPTAVVEKSPVEANAGSPPGSDKHSMTTSMSDRQSCVSAPLPVSHLQPEISDNPPRYSYCFADSEKRKKKKKKMKVRAPLALPDRNGISSSRESSLKPRNGQPPQALRPRKPPEIDSDKGLPESAPSEMSSVREPSSYLETPVPYSSCASSDISVPAPCTLQTRPPIPGAPDVRRLGPTTGGQPITSSAPPNNYPRPFYVPANFEYPGDPSMRLRNPNYASYPKSIPEERYVAMPKRPNGFIGHRLHETEHVYESIDDPQQNGHFPPPNGVPQSTAPEQNGPSRQQENNVTDSESTSLLGPQQGPHLNGPSSEQHLPRRRPRERKNHDKSRTRRYREGGAYGKRRDPSSRSGGVRSSATSLKSDRVKPEPKEWIPDSTPRLTYVPVPHIATKPEPRNETSV